MIRLLQNGSFDPTPALRRARAMLSRLRANFIAECNFVVTSCKFVVYTNSPVQVASLTSIKAIAAIEDQSFALRTDGTVWTWGGGIPTPVQVQNLDNVKAIGAGYAIRDDPNGTRNRSRRTHR